MRWRLSLWMLMACVLANSLLLGRCSKSSNPSSSAIRGTVILEHRTSYEGVNIKLFISPQIDPDLAHLQGLYPKAGVPLCPQTLFDRRQATFIARTETGANGSYVFSDVSAGEYIVVAEKDGYGYQERFDVVLTPGKETVVPQIDLLEEKELFGELTTSAVLDANRHYLVSSDVIVASGATLTIEPGVHVKFDGYYSLLVNGRLEASGTEDRMIVFTSAQPTPDEDDWRRIEFGSSGQGGEMTWCKVEYANSGIHAKGVPLSLSYSVFHHHADDGTRIYSTFQLPVVVKNNLMMNNKLGLWLENVDNGTVEGNIILNNREIGIGCQGGAPWLSNNLSQKNEYGLYCLFHSSPVCRRSSFVENVWAMACGGWSKPNMSLCNFVTNNNGAVFVFIPDQGARAQPTINFCNFDEQNLFIHVAGHPQAPNDLDIDATHNYWGGLSQDEIAQLILDKNDVPPELAPYVGQVNFIPMETAKIDSAGLL